MPLPPTSFMFPQSQIDSVFYFDYSGYKYIKFPKIYKYKSQNPFFPLPTRSILKPTKYSS